jgi:hypothetical protein
MNPSEPDFETRLHEALTEAAAPIHGDGVQREAVIQDVARRRRTRWAARAAVVATAAAAVVALVLLTRPDGGRVDTVGRPSTTATESTVPEPTSSSTSSSTTSSTTTSSTTSTTTAVAPVTPAVGPDTPVSRSGIGPIRVGMTVREAEQAAGVTITPGEPIGPGSTCVEAQIEDFDIFLQLSITGTPGEDLTQGVVRLVAGQGIRSTVEGVAVGDPVSEVTATYGNATRTTDYPYVTSGNGEVLVYEDGGHAYGVIVDGPTVIQLQSGDATSMPSIEGCV